MSELVGNTDPRKETDSFPVLSAEIFILPLDHNKHLIYAPLRRAAFIGNTSIVNFLADLKEGVWNRENDPELKLTEFLRKLEIVDAGSEKLPIDTYTGQPDPSSVTLFLTTACNLRCTYCYAMAGDTPVQSMSIEVAKNGINFVAENAKKRGDDYFEVYYHGGGEPTMNWSVLTSSFEYSMKKAKFYGLKVRGYSALNGVISDEKIEWIIKNLQGVSLSFDGLPEVHDTHRRTQKGKGSSKEVLHTIMRFDLANFNYNLRLTVTKDQIPQLRDSVEYICENFHPKRVHVEPAYLIGRWKDAPSAETESFISMYREARLVAKKHEAILSFSSARLGLLTNHFCGVSQDSFALSSKGNVSGCFEVFHEENDLADTFFYGKPKASGAGYVFDLSVLNNLRQQAVQYREYCQNCFAKWSCAGDCYHKSLTVNGEKEFTGTDRCHITRELTKDQILEKIVDSGGVFWHEPPLSES